MTYQTISYLLILILLGISCARVFFLHSAREDCLSVLPSLVLIINILVVIAFGIGIFSLLTLALSFFVWLWNIRAVQRFRSQLIVDRYSVAFILISLFNLVLVILLGTAIILFRPAKNPQNTAMQKNVQRYTGSFEKGFFIPTEPFTYTPLSIYTYSSDIPKAESKGYILFIPSERSSIDLYEPLLVHLAQDGYTVLAAEYYAKDYLWLGIPFDISKARHFLLCYAKLLNLAQYNVFVRNKRQNMAQLYASMLRLASLTEDNTVYLVGDEAMQGVFSIALAQNEDLIDGVFDLANIPFYNTKGYGPIAQTEPILARFLGFKKDATISSNMAAALEHAIKTTGDPYDAY